MAHDVGEHLRCDKCGAEIVYVKACPCPEQDRDVHADICCGHPMTSLGVEPTRARAQPQPHP